MAAFALVLPGLALLLLAAHFLHAGLWPATMLCLAMLPLLAVRRTWAMRVLQWALALGALEWLITAVMLARLRLTHGQPYMRLVIILGAVAVVTVLAALVFQHPSVRERYRAPRPPIGAG
ncbi:MAG TPA: hypothetical protein VMT50_08025 [Steroidobacteraceae bacterium]|nr:hypothetical protein [Steroidobacteraceae bacterium]